MAILLKEQAPAPRPLSPRHPWRPAPRIVEVVVAISGVAAAAVILFDFGGEFLAAFKFGVCLVLPGWAILLRLPEVDFAARLVWTVVASVATYTAIALAMGWLQLWNPRPASAAVLLAAALYVTVAPRPRAAIHFRLHRPAFRASVRWVLLAVAMVMWAVALTWSSKGDLGSLGLLAAFPLMWFFALAIVIGLCLWGVAAREVSSSFMSGAVMGLVLMLYTSASLVADVPRLPWTYKHIAVTDLIGATGGIDPSIDIYNRWPGFFSLSAFLGETVGYRDALSYAALAETGFALIDVVLVLAIARTFSRNPRVHWTAVIVFALTNWVNQNYYSPQAFAYTLHLTMCLIVLTFLRGNPAGWVLALERRLTRARLRPPEVGTGEDAGRTQQTVAIIAVLVLQCVIVASHQLTPYLAILGFFPLFIVGYFRPKWLAPALLVIALLYLLPNVDFVKGKYGLFSGLDIFTNVGYKKSSAEPGQWLVTGRAVAKASLALSVLTGLLAVGGFLRRILQGHVRSALIVGFLATAPILGLFGTSYGGEARLRVYLFAVPWLAIGVAWLFWSGPLRLRPAVVGMSASVTVMAVLFTGIYLAPEAGLRMPKAEVAASKWLDRSVQKGDMVVETNSHLPLLIGPNYPRYLATGGVSSLNRKLRYSTRTVTVEDVISRAGKLSGSTQRRSGGKIYVVISDDQPNSGARSTRPLPPGVLANFEHELIVGNRVDKVFEESSIRIYAISMSA